MCVCRLRRPAPQRGQEDRAQGHQDQDLRAAGTEGNRLCLPLLPLSPSFTDQSPSLTHSTRPGSEAPSSPTSRRSRRCAVPPFPSSLSFFFLLHPDPSSLSHRCGSQQKSIRRTRISSTRRISRRAWHPFHSHSSHRLPPPLPSLRFASPLALFSILLSRIPRYPPFPLVPPLPSPPPLISPRSTRTARISKSSTKQFVCDSRGQDGFERGQLSEKRSVCEEGRKKGSKDRTCWGRGKGSKTDERSAGYGEERKGGRRERKECEWTTVRAERVGRGGAEGKAGEDSERV